MLFSGYFRVEVTRKRTRVILISIYGLIIVLFLLVCNNINNSIEALKPIITEDISESETALLLDEFGICLPPEAEITAFSFAEEEIKIRIEDVEDLPAFLTDSPYLGISEEEAESLTEIMYGCFERDTNPFTDMFGVEHQCWSIIVSEDRQAIRISYQKTLFNTLTNSKTIPESNPQ